MSDDITRALTAVLEPAPGRTVPITAVHGAVIQHMGHSTGASYRAIKDTLRAVGIVVTNRRPGVESHVHGVALSSGYAAAQRHLRTRSTDN